MKENQTPWTDVELEASVRAYLDVLTRERSGEIISPTAAIRAMQSGELVSRNLSSLSQRMGNITSTFADEGLPTSYTFRAPRPGVGQRVRGRILTIFEKLSAFDLSPTFSRAELETKVAAAKSATMARPVGQAAPAATVATVTVYARDPKVVLWVLQEAEGVCEACDEPAPFLRADGSPFLEVHHVVHLADQGADCVENAVALCPNCHRRLHYSADSAAYRARLQAKLPRLAMGAAVGVTHDVLDIRR